MAIHPPTAAAILGMAAVTYATKASGLWALGRVDLSDSAAAGLEALPGAVVVAILAPRLVEGGPPEWAGAAVVAGVAWRTDSVLAALVAGVGTVLLLRGA